MQGEVVLVGGDFAGFLGGEGDADAERLWVFGKCAVVIAGAEAQAVAEVVEGQEGGEDDVWRYLFGERVFCVEAAGGEGDGGLPGAKDQRVAFRWGFGEAEGLASLVQCQQERHDVDFAM